MAFVTVITFVFHNVFCFKKFRVYDPYSVLGTVIKYSSVLIDFTGERIEQTFNSYKILTLAEICHWLFANITTFD